MYNVGDKVVYPMHGAGVIDSIEEKEILGEKQSYYILKMPGEVKVMVPISTAEQHGIRNVIDKNEAERVINVLEQDETEMEKNWNKPLCKEPTSCLRALWKKKICTRIIAARS